MLELFLIVTLMLTLWCMLYHLSHILSPVRPDKTKNSSEWHCRRITVIHAVVVVILSAWSAFVQGPWPFTHPGIVVGLIFPSNGGNHVTSCF